MPHYHTLLKSASSRKNIVNFLLPAEIRYINDLLDPHYLAKIDVPYNTLIDTIDQLRFDKKINVITAIKALTVAVEANNELKIEQYRYDAHLRKIFKWDASSQSYCFQQEGSSSHFLQLVRSQGQYVEDLPKIENFAEAIENQAEKIAELALKMRDHAQIQKRRL